MNAVRNRSFSSFLIKAALILLMLLAAGQFVAAFAQDQTDQTKAAPDQPKDELYVIGALDRLSITFWQQPDLNRDVRVDQNGMISLPVIGDIKAAGLTPNELSKRIIQQMSIYNTPVSQATVTVTEYNSRSVVVGGHVLTPGSKRYEQIPDLWQVILDAGGPTSDADLSRVTIVRKQGGKSDVINVDLFKIIKSGDLSQAPQLMAGDLVNVPQSSLGTNLAFPSQPKFEGKNIFYVFGQVIEQGPRNLEEGMDVLDGVAAARGFGPNADLKNVRIILKDAKFSNIVKFDLDKYTKTGQPPRMMLHPEDTIIIPAKSGGWSQVLSTLGTVAPILATMGTLLILVRDINRNP
jgi:polysaccharide biosynthesis/export protein